MNGAGSNDLTVAVGRLGEATEVARAALAPLPREVVALARRLAADDAAAAAASALRDRYRGAVTTLESSLDRVWPRSSAARPAGAAGAIATCGAIAEAAAAPVAGLARKLASLPGPDAARMASEADHVLETEARLERMGIPAAPSLADANARAAMALDALAAEHDLKDAAEARARLATLEEACRAAALCEEPATRSAVALGFRDATTAQSRTVTVALAGLGRPWHPLLGLSGDPVPVAETLEARASGLSEHARLSGVGGIPPGTEWLAEPAPRLAAASVILSDPTDARAPSARAYASSLGVRGGDGECSETLLAMARCTRAREGIPPVPADAEGLAQDADLDTPEGCLAAAAAARDLGSWLDAMDTSSLTAMALAALRGMAPRDRDATLVDAVAASNGLPALVAACPTERLAGLSDRLARRRVHIAELLSEASLAEDGALAARAARSLRERRLALARITASPGFESSGAGSAERVVEAQAWVDRLRGMLPPGIEPTSPSVEGTVIPGAAVALRDAIEVSECLSEADCLVAGGFEALALAEAAALPVAALARARADVGAVDGWDAVARLEEQGLPPSEWLAALEAELAEPEAPPAPETRTESTTVPAFDFSDAELWEEATLAVLPPHHE